VTLERDARTRARRSLPAIVLLALLSVGASVVAHAEEDRVSKAAAAFERGSQAYREGKLDEALEAFLASNALASRPNTLLNIAQCYRQLGGGEKALSYYRLYLAESRRQKPGEKPPHEEEVSAHIATLEVEVARAPDPRPPSGTLSVSTQPRGAEVLLDGSPAGQSPLVVKSVPVGTHRLEVKLADRATHALSVEIVADRTAAVSVELESPAGHAHPSFWHRRRIWTWVAAGVAVAAAGTGLGVRLSANSDYDEYLSTSDAARFDELRDSVPRKDRAAVTLFSMAGALAATAVILLFFEGQPR
jgi:tetratricopeptide (TPR) repeat protein